MVKNEKQAKKRIPTSKKSGYFSEAAGSQALSLIGCSERFVIFLIVGWICTINIEI